MKKAIITLSIAVAVLGAGCVYAYEPVPEAEEQPMIEYTVDEAVDEAVDELPTETIEIVTPYQDMGWYLYHTCEDMGYENFELAFGIARYETGNFTSKAFTQGFNWGGLSKNDVPFTFENHEEGCKAFVELLKKYDGLTVEELSQKWCPCNPDYAETLRKIMSETEVIISVE